MTCVTLKQAEAIIDAVLARGREFRCRPPFMNYLIT